MKIAVVGGGSIGSMAAWQLSCAGHEVVIFDRFAAPNSLTAHSGESRLLRSIPYLEKAAGDRAILADAGALWAQLEHEAGKFFVARSGGLIIGEAEDPQLVEAARLARVRDGSDAVLDAGQLAARFPQLARAVEGELAVFDREGGLIDPQRAVEAALDAACRTGADLRTHDRVLDVSETRGGVRVRSERSDIDVDAAVVASGAYLPELLPALPVRVRRLLLGWFSPEAGKEHLRECPSFVWDSAAGFVYGGPSSDGRTFKIGTDAPWGDADDAANTHARHVTENDARAMTEVVARMLPWLDATSGRFEMHLDGWTPDQHGILGLVPGAERIFAAGGFSGHGFKIAPVLGRIVALLVCGHSPGYDIGHLSPSRFASRA